MMNPKTLSRSVAYAAVIAAMLGATSMSARAAIVITEVAPWSSGNSPVGADWFELTNTGAADVSITGWKMDDNSNLFGNAVALTGITTIKAGESVIFIETSNLTSATSSFLSTWFGSQAPASLQIGAYSGSGVGLGTSGDAVNIFDASGVLQAKVIFGSSPSGPTYATFDNSALLNNASISTLSVAGAHGAFVAAGDSSEIGSPGSVPEPGTLVALGCGALALAQSRRRW